MTRRWRFIRAAMRYCELAIAVAPGSMQDNARAWNDMLDAYRNWQHPETKFQDEE